MLDWIVSWNLTYLAHSTILLAGALLAARLVPARAQALLDAIWKTALVGGLVTATIQVGLGRFGGVEPLGGSWRLAAESAGAVAGERSEPGSVGAALEGSPPRAAITESALAASHEEDALRAAAVQAAAEGAPSAQSAAGRGLGVSVAAVLTTLWLTGAAILLLLLGLSWQGLRRRLADRRFLRQGALASFLERLIEETRKPTPAVLAVSERIDIPLAWGLRQREICLPERLIEDMPRERQELVLAHELAHHERRDPVWLLAARVVESVWFFQPLNRVARRRLQETAEFLCDDRAVEQTGRPISLARCLTEVAEWRLAGSGAWPAPTLAAERDRLTKRVSRLLDRAYPLPAVRGPRWMGAALAVALIAVALVVPGVSAAIEEQLPSPPSTPEVERAPAAPLAPNAVDPVVTAPLPPTAPRAEPVTVAPVAPFVVAAIEPAPAPTAAPKVPAVGEAPEAPEALQAPQAPEALGAPVAPAAPEAPEPPEGGHYNGGWIVLEEELGEFSEFETRIEELSARIAELAERASPSPEALARIEAASRRIAQHAGSDAARAVQAAHTARLEALAERLEASGEASEETAEIEAQLRAEAKALAEAVRPDDEAMGRLRDELEREFEEVGPEREEMRRLQEELRHEVETHRSRLREEVRERAGLRRDELERAHREVQRERESLGRLNREELRRLREEVLETHALDRAELDRLRAEVDRLVEEALELRGQLDSSPR